MFPTKTVVFMSAFLMAAPFGLSSSAVSAYPGEGLMEGARDMQQDMNQARRDFRDLKENNSDRGSYREDRDMRRPPRDGIAPMVTAICAGLPATACVMVSAICAGMTMAAMRDGAVAEGMTGEMTNPSC